MLLPVLARAGAAVDGEGEAGAFAQRAHDVGQHGVAAGLGQPLVELAVESREMLGLARLGRLRCRGAASPAAGPRSRDRGAARRGGRSVLPAGRAPRPARPTISGVIAATLAPRRGSRRTSPSPERPSRASRTGTRDTPSSADSRSSTRRSPGLQRAVEDAAADLVADDLAERRAIGGHGSTSWQGRHEGGDAGLAAGDVLLAVAARGRDPSRRIGHRRRSGKPPTNTVKRPSCWVKMPKASSPGSAFL